MQPIIVTHRDGRRVIVGVGWCIREIDNDGAVLQHAGDNPLLETFDEIAQASMAQHVIDPEEAKGRAASPRPRCRTCGDTGYDPSASGPCFSCEPRARRAVDRLTPAILRPARPTLKDADWDEEEFARRIVEWNARR